MCFNLESKIEHFLRPQNFVFRQPIINFSIAEAFDTVIAFAVTSTGFGAAFSSQIPRIVATDKFMVKPSEGFG